jgi:hypothetical protein
MFRSLLYEIISEIPKKEETCSFVIQTLRHHGKANTDLRHRIIGSESARDHARIQCKL